jgi:hypothetical protein
MPNPQFAAHNNIPGNVYPNGTASVVIAPGGSAGWYFAKPTGSSDTDIIEFDYLNVEQPGLPGNPRWALITQCTGTASADASKSLRLRFDNVNRFASTTQSYTFAFWGMSTSGAILNFQTYKYFGAGGSTPVTTPRAQFTLTENYEVNQITFEFGENESDTIGPNNDDYIELVINYPSTSIYAATVSDFILTPGQVNFQGFPERPDHDVFATGIAGSMPIPDPNGGDLYLPIIYTPTGFNFDMSPVGEVVASFKAAPGPNELLCDGSTYFMNQFSASGIPYSRLGNVLWNNGGYHAIMLFGSGPDFVSSFTTANTGEIIIANNQASTSTPVGAGTSGFEFTTLSEGGSTAIPVFCASLSASQAYIRYNSFASGGMGNLVSSDGSAITITILNQIANTNFQAIINVINAAAVTTGDTLTLTYSNAATQVVYFNVNGSGSPPSGSIEVGILTGDSIAVITDKIVTALANGWMSAVEIPAGSDITNSTYFTFSANSVDYQVLYATTKPDVLTSNQIFVLYTSLQNADTIASNTIVAINNFAFAVPDLAGMTLRGVDTSAIWDPLASARSGFGSFNWYGPGPGTFEYDEYISHVHAYTPPVNLNPTVVSAGTTFAVSGGAVNTLASGGAETRGMNVSVNWYIKY